MVADGDTQQFPPIASDVVEPDACRTPDHEEENEAPQQSANRASCSTASDPDTETVDDDLTRELAELFARADAELTRAVGSGPEAHGAETPQPPNSKPFPLGEFTNRDWTADAASRRSAWNAANDSGRHSDGSADGADGAGELLGALEFDVEFELGRTRLEPHGRPDIPSCSRRTSDLEPGTILTLDQVAADPIDIVVDGRVIGRGEVLIVDECLSFRVVEIF